MWRKGGIIKLNFGIFYGKNGKKYLFTYSLVREIRYSEKDSELLVRLKK